MSIERIDFNEFRRKLAGLEEPERITETYNKGYQIDAAMLCRVMAELFGEELDRLTLWSRIDSGLRLACAKAPDGNLERFLSLCLEHVKADPARASGNEDVDRLLLTFAKGTPEWRRGFVAYVRNNIYAVLVHGRNSWNVRKEEMKSKSKAKVQSAEAVEVNDE